MILTISSLVQVMVQESSSTILDPCSVYAYGGAKDFTISVNASGAGGNCTADVASMLELKYISAEQSVQMLAWSGFRAVSLQVNLNPKLTTVVCLVDW